MSENINNILTFLRSAFIEQTVYIKGQPYSFADREYLRAIVDADASRILIRAGRQTEKSTMIASIMVADCCVIPHFKALYVTLSGKQVSDFSNDKLHPILTFSPVIYNNYYTGGRGDIIKRVTDKSLSNGSHIFLRSAYRTAETIRGISADRIAIDEFQSILTDNVYVIQECAARSKYRWFIYSGTGRTTDNPLEYYWQRTNQCEWLIKCSHCGHYNYQDEKILRPEFLACVKCDSVLDIRNGIWVEFAPSSTDFYGFRITQYMLPGQNITELYEKLQVYGLARFYNEVLGLPYDLASRPIRHEELLRNCEPRHNEIAVMPQEHIPIAAIDWGTGLASFTVIGCGYWDGEKLRVVYAKRFYGTDPAQDLEEIKAIIYRTGAQLIVADWGFGHLNNDLLAKHLRAEGRVFAPVMYVEGAQEAYKWDGYKYKVNRTQSMSEMFNMLKKDKVKFPSNNEFASFLTDIMNIYIDYRESATRSTMFYNHAPDKPDDFAHVLNLMLIAVRIFGRRNVAI